MGNPKGDVVRCELLTTDAAQRFSGDVVGWTRDPQCAAFGLVGSRIAQP